MQKHAFRDVLRFFLKKISFIKKSVAHSKNKERKTSFIIKKRSTNVFQVCKSIVYDSFNLELSISTALLLWR